MESILSGLADYIPHCIKAYTSPLIFNNGDLGGRDDSPISGLSPWIFSEDFFLCHRGYCQVCETSETVFVAICARSSYKMPGLFRNMIYWTETPNCNKFQVSGSHHIMRQDSCPRYCQVLPNASGTIRTSHSDANSN